MKKIILLAFITSIVSTHLFASVVTNIRDTSPKIRTIQRMNITPSANSVNVVFTDNSIVYCYNEHVNMCLQLQNAIGKSLTTNMMGNAFHYEINL